VPTYDYQCRDCGTVTEVIHAMSEDGPTVCDACGGTLRRVLYPAGIIFKGSGFYRTDSRAAPPESSPAAKAPKEGTSTGEGSTASASDGGTPSSTSTTKPSPGASGTASGSTSGD
jgi:putative FmdB family regulatory protein